MTAVWWRLSLLGLIGVASLLLVPIEEMTPIQMEPALLRLLATAQPAILVAGFVALGLWAAPKVGFDAPAVRAWADQRPVTAVLRRQFPAATVMGLAAAAVLLAFDLVIRPTAEGAHLLRFALPLPTRLLYGGIVEELLMRWGAMSFVAWLVWRLAGRPASLPSWMYWTSIVAAALLFAVGHLPALSFLLPDAPRWIVATVVAANFTAGVLFGWLFWKKGLEAAMMGHGFAHLFAWAALLAL